MALANYSDLKTAIADWLDRNDLSGNVEDFITLAEARLNRELEAVETTNTSLTGTEASRTVDISALDLIEPIACYLSSAATDEAEVEFVPPGSFEYETTSGFPDIVSVDGTNLIFNRPLDAAYSIRLRYRGRFALSDSSPTNDLLTNHPDVYLAASLVWSGTFTRDDTLIAGFSALLDGFLRETKNHLAQKKRGINRPDTAIIGLLDAKRTGTYLR